MEKYLGANWLTTVVGFALGGAYAALTALTQGLTVKDAAIAAAFAVLGLVAKSFNVTGIGQNATTDVSKDGTKPVSGGA